jgi:hypothetical protein
MEGEMVPLEPEALDDDLCPFSLQSSIPWTLAFTLHFGVVDSFFQSCMMLLHC